MTRGCGGGSWEDFCDHICRFDASATIAVDATLDVIPVFVRAEADGPGRP